MSAFTLLGSSDMKNVASIALPAIRPTLAGGIPLCLGSCRVPPPSRCLLPVVMCWAVPGAGAIHNLYSQKVVTPSGAMAWRCAFCQHDDEEAGHALYWSGSNYRWERTPVKLQHSRCRPSRKRDSQNLLHEAVNEVHENTSRSCPPEASLQALVLTGPPIVFFASRRPELSCGVVDYLDPAALHPGYSSASDAAMAAPVLFVLDECPDPLELQHMQASLAATLESVPPATRVGIITYGKAVSVYDLSHTGVAAADIIPGEPPAHPGSLLRTDEATWLGAELAGCS